MGKEAQHQGVTWGEGQEQIGHQGQVPIRDHQVHFPVGQAQSTSYLCCPIELQAVLQLEFIIL